MIVQHFKYSMFLLPSHNKIFTKLLVLHEFVIKTFMISFVKKLKQKISLYYSLILYFNKYKTSRMIMSIE
jgi:hypothetical protein